MENKTYTYTFGNITITGSKELIDQVRQEQAEYARELAAKQS